MRRILASALLAAVALAAAVPVSLVTAGKAAAVVQHRTSASFTDFSVGGRGKPPATARGSAHRR